MSSQPFPTSVEEALALGYSLSQVDELRANIKRHNQTRPQSSSRPKQQSFPSFGSDIEEDDEDSETIDSKNNTINQYNGINENIQNIERAIRLANHQAMLLLMEKDIEGSKVFLNQADEVLNDAPQFQDEKYSSILNGLQILTWNNEASWWKSSGDPAKSLEVLGKALQLAEDTRALPPTDRATTCSNLAAVLSQLDRHPLALTYAREAVLHCKAALAEAKDAVSIVQNKKSDLKNVKTVMGTFAVACHNLAVEIEHVNGVAEALSWYKEAVHLAQSATTIVTGEEEGVGLDGTCRQLGEAFINAKKKHKRAKQKLSGFKHVSGVNRKGKKQKKSSIESNIIYQKPTTDTSEDQTKEYSTFDFGDNFWTPNPEKVELKSLKLVVSQKRQTNQCVRSETRHAQTTSFGISESKDTRRKPALTTAQVEEMKCQEARDHASELLAKEQARIAAVNKVAKLRKLVKAARTATTTARWSSMARVRSGLGLTPSPGMTQMPKTFPGYDEEEQMKQEDEPSDDEGDVFFVENVQAVSDESLDDRPKNWDLTGSSKTPFPDPPMKLPKTAPAGPPSPFGEPDWNWRAPKAPDSVIKLEHPLLGAAKGMKRASHIRHKKMSMWKEADPLAKAAETQARRSADYWDAAAAAAVRRWGKGYHHPGLQPPPGRHKPAGLNKPRPQSAPQVVSSSLSHSFRKQLSPDKARSNEDCQRENPLLFNVVNRRRPPQELEIDGTMIAPRKGYSLLAEPSSCVGDRLLSSTRRNIETGEIAQPQNSTRSDLRKTKQSTTSDSAHMVESEPENYLQRAQLSLAYESAKVSALSHLLVDPVEGEEEQGHNNPDPPLELSVETRAEVVMDEEEESKGANHEITQEGEYVHKKEGGDDDDDESNADYDDDFEDLGSINQQQEVENVALEIVGREVRKHFEGFGVFCGVVVGPAGGKSWEIEYEDGDSEVLGWSDLQTILLPPNGYDVQSIAGTSVPNSPVQLTPKSRAAKYFYNNENLSDAKEALESSNMVNGVENIHLSKKNDDSMNFEEANSASLTTEHPLGEVASSSSARHIVSPGTIPITEMSVEEMMVMNLQRQIKEAIASDDLDRAATLNAKLSHLEETLIKNRH